MCSNRWVSYIYKSSNPIDRDSTFVREVIDSTETIVNCTAPDGLTEIFYASNSLCTVVENGGNATFSTEEADRLQTLKSTPPLNMPLQAIACLATNIECVVIGNKAYVSVDPTGGSSAWTGESIPDPNINHSAMVCISLGECIAVGDDILIGTAYLKPTTPCTSLALVGQPFRESLSAQYGQPPYSWTISQGSLPSGLTLSPSGIISGTPIISGSATVSVQVSDSSSLPERASESLSLVSINSTTQAYVLADSRGDTTTLTSQGSLSCSGSLYPLSGPVVGIASTSTQPKGYWLATSSGAIYSFGDASYFGSTGQINPQDPPGTTNQVNPPVNNVVSIASTSDSKGYWLATSSGAIYSFGDASYFGSTGQINPQDPPGPTNELNPPVNNVVSIASTSDGKGYWLVAGDGGVFSFGDASFLGSSGQMNPALPPGGSNSFIPATPIVGMSPTPDGKGYWLATSTGAIYSFGDANYFGSTGQINPQDPPGTTNQVNPPINNVVSIASTSDSKGYWLATSSGAIYSFGDANYLGGWASGGPTVGIGT